MATELTTISKLELFDTNKQGRCQFAESVVEAIESGSADPLKVHIFLKNIEEIANTLTSTDQKKNKNFELAKRFKSALLEEADKHGKAFDYHNARIEQRELGAKWNYENCNDPLLIDLEAKMASLKEKITDRQKFLQNLPDGGTTLILEDTGEAITIYKPFKTSTTSIVVKLQ